MSIRRAPRPERYYVISHEIIDAGLSAEALGVLVYVLSRPDNWVIYPSQLATQFNCGRNRITRILKEIRNLGYAQYTKIRDKNGSFTKVEWVFSEAKAPHPQNPEVENRDTAETLVNTPEVNNGDTVTPPHPQNPHVENPYVENEALLNKDYITNKDLITKTDISFGDFWKFYPRKTNRDQAEKSFAKLKPDKQLFDQIILNIERRLQLGDWSLDAKNYIPHASTFLNQRRWQDEIIPRGENNACQQNHKLSSVERLNVNLKRRSAARERVIQNQRNEPDKVGVVVPKDDWLVRQ